MQKILDVILAGEPAEAGPPQPTPVKANQPVPEPGRLVAGGGAAADGVPAPRPGVTTEPAEPETLSDAAAEAQPRALLAAESAAETDDQELGA